jgi:hypothetical protein
MSLRPAGALVLAFWAVASTAAAQGNGHGHAYGHTTRGSGPSASTTPGLQPAGETAGIFGSWLDDASLAGVGEGSLTLSLGYWRTPAYREWDMPVADASVGLTRRVQVGASAPYFHAGEPGGAVAHGMGDLYLNAKILLRDPATRHRRVGFSMTPLVEVLSAAPAPDRSRASWGLPGNVEVRGTGWRAFGSGGYFSRGALFASGALEVPLSTRAWVTGSVSRSHSIKREDGSFALGLAQTRTDVACSVSAAVRSMTVFGSLGRTLSKRDANSSTLALTSGVTVNFPAWTRP